MCLFKGSVICLAPKARPPVGGSLRSPISPAARFARFPRQPLAALTPQHGIEKKNR